MIDPLTTVLIVAALLLTLAAAVHVVLDRVPDWPLIAGLALLELGLLGQLVVGIVHLVGGSHEVAAVTFVGYLVAVLLVLPAGLAWSLGEQSRSGTAVLVLAVLVVAFLVLRLQQIWGAAGA